MGKAVLKKRLRREQVTDFFGSVAPCVVAMEATRGAHYLARVIGTFGHEVRLIAPRFVKPYVRGQKNDMRDAAAICEAASRPEIRFVPQKSIQQQDMQMLHRIRSRLVGNRTQLSNQIRGLLAEYGIVVPLHLSYLRKQLSELTSEPHLQLTPFAQELFASLYAELCSIDERITAMERRVQQAFHREEACQKIAEVEGVGPVTATAIVAAISDGERIWQWPATGGLAGAGSPSTFKRGQTAPARYF